MSAEELILYIVGGFVILVGITKFRFNSRRTQRLVRQIGVAGTQIFYIVLGIVLIVINYLLP